MTGEDSKKESSIERRKTKGEVRKKRGDVVVVHLAIGKGQVVNAKTKLQPT